MKWKAKWIKPSSEMGDVCSDFSKKFTANGMVKKATLFVTALGVYEAKLNGERVSDYVLAPGFTSYNHRLQFQEYDVTDQIKKENYIHITVGKGWYRSRLVGWEVSKIQQELQKAPAGLLVQLEIVYGDGSSEIIGSDESWKCCESNVLFSEIYDGETYDASENWSKGQYTGSQNTMNTDAVIKTKVIKENSVQVFDGPFHKLIPQQGEEIKETEFIYGSRIFRTPNGEIVIDFGQEVTGYVEINLEAKNGEVVELSHGEVLDKEGNFYNENYRSAKAKYRYICKNGKQTYKPKLTFFGFRYIRIDSFPGGVESARLNQFRAIVIYSDIKRTGHLSCSNEILNQLFDNIVWGQKCNFLDIPTDCPQRDERLGWTGDAQVFVKTASFNYDVEKFFTKWLADLAADQGEDGRVGHIIPDLLGGDSSAAWGDAVTICPWEIYLAYGNPKILSNQFESMKKWIGYISAHTKDKFLWTGGQHFGDWLGLDAPIGSYKGSSREDFIASAFYAYSTSLVIKAGKVLGKDVSDFEVLYNSIVNAFRTAFPEYYTQTECILAVRFNLATDCQTVVEQLVSMVKESGIQLKTGFVGTPYLLHVLSDYGYIQLAYSLLLREKYPSWLFPVTKGATTVWEHWDGIMENGDFWSADMNSFNHYAYGAVADWVYEVAAGIKVMEKYPGYQKVTIVPNPDSRLGWLKASLITRYGLIRSEWKKAGNYWRYEIETPVEACINIGGDLHEVTKGIYTFFSMI